VLQLRIASGLIDYPGGKSAMVWYGHVPNVSAAAAELAERYPSDSLLCRHLIEIESPIDLGAYCEKLRREFVRRFGARPRFENDEPRRS
jgi:hypothetical protein